MDDSHVIARLREQLTNLCGRFALSLLLHGRVEDDEILELVVSAVPALGPCRVEGAYLIRLASARTACDAGRRLVLVLSALDMPAILGPRGPWGSPAIAPQCRAVVSAQTANAAGAPSGRRAVDLSRSAPLGEDGD
jgi:hypothetical protein